MSNSEIIYGTFDFLFYRIYLVIIHFAYEILNFLNKIFKLNIFDHNTIAYFVYMCAIGGLF